MLEVHNLSKKFHSLTAVNHINLTIQEGEIFGLLGTNGAGKTTLLRMLAGILKPDTGTVLIDGQAVFDNPLVKKNCFYLSDRQFFFSNATPESMGCFYKNVYPDFDCGRYTELLKEFDFDRFKKIRTFSKGMKKQTAVLAAICANTSWLFCDEVFDGLDPVIRQSVMALLKTEMTRRPLTPIAASHNLKELEGFCGHMGILHKGGILISRDIHSIQYKTHKLQCILDEPQIAMLAHSPDVISIHQEGFVTTILMQGSKEDIVSRLKELHPERYDFLPLSLEEIFINETEAIGYDIKLLFS